MATSINFNPLVTTNAAGLFGVQANGLTQGVAFDDPNTRFNLASGYSTDSLPIWGGILLQENLPTSGSGFVNGHAGNAVQRATSVSNAAGFAVFNQSYNGVNWPQNTTPLILPGMSVNYYRLGSGARIPVQCDPGLAAALLGNASNQQVSWDFNNQVLQPYDAATATYAITSMTAGALANGSQTVAIVAAAATPVAAVGDFINISGATNTGTGGAAIVNGNFQVTAFTSNTVFSISVPNVVAGSIGTIAGTIVLNYGTGALPCRIVGPVAAGNSRVVSWNGVNANWADNGNAVLIQI